MFVFFIIIVPGKKAEITPSIDFVLPNRFSLLLTVLFNRYPRQRFSKSRNVTAHKYKSRYTKNLCNKEFQIFHLLSDSKTFVKEYFITPL